MILVFCRRVPKQPKGCDHARSVAVRSSLTELAVAAQKLLGSVSRRDRCTCSPLVVASSPASAALSRACQKAHWRAPAQRCADGLAVLPLRCCGRRLWCVGGGRRARQCALGRRTRELGKACWRCLVPRWAAGLRRDLSRFFAAHPRQDAGLRARSLVVVGSDNIGNVFLSASIWRLYQADPSYPVCSRDVHGCFLTLAAFAVREGAP